MASTQKCPFCGAVMRSDERTCPQCGAANEQFVPVTEKTIFLPKTIEELKEYCAQRGMPLLRMRFFIGEDFREPKAFGIYQDGDRYVVYKNKASGDRAIRYSGPDEAYAVKELFQKLLDECHQRGIYPDGQPDEEPPRSSGKEKRGLKKYTYILIIAICLVLAAIIGYLRQRSDGYYRLPDQRIVYRYQDNWYYYDSSVSDWRKGNSQQYDSSDDAYLGKDYDSDWGEPSFKDSATWQEIQDSHSSGSSDYDSWDSNDTDWDSDW